MGNNYLKFIAFVFLFLSVVACARPTMQTADWYDVAFDRSWPEPPATPRVKLLRVISSQSDLNKDDTSGQFFDWLLGASKFQMPLVSSYGICADGSGRVWLADPGSGAVHFYDLAAKAVDYIVQFGDDRFVSPVGLAIDVQRQRLYVSDSVLRRVFVFDFKGNAIEEIVKVSGFNRPSMMTVDSTGKLYVVDTLSGKIEVFAPEGQHLRTVLSAASENGLFNRPVGIAVDFDGVLYVSDSMNYRVVVQSAQGDLIKVFGSVGDSLGSMARPRGIALDSEKHIYVVDAAFDTVQIFDLAGNLLLYFGQPGKMGGEFCLPAGIFIDQSDRIYLAESCNGRFQVFQYLSVPDS